MINFTPFDKTFLTIGPIALNYYGLMYALGTIAVYFIGKKLVRKQNIPITDDQILDLISYGIFGVILGGRIGYILFYNLSYYFTEPLKIFAVWEGGMSFHGGLLGVILGGYLFCHKNQFNFYRLADFFIIPVFLALALGRIGNFINGELVGRITEMPWGVEFPNHIGKRHPSQLYQSGKDFFIFFTLLTLLKYKFKTGTYFWLGISVYGFLRFLIEFTREPDVQIGFLFQYFSLGQILSLPMFLIGILMIYKINKQKD